MGVFTTRRGRVRIWVYALAFLVLVPMCGLVAAMFIQPERFARDDGCVTAGDDGITNQCSRTVVMEACVSGDDGIRECARQEIEGGATIERPASLPAGDLQLAACHAPYLPAKVTSPLNLSLLIDGCRKPE
ncbi:hypothetical protein ACKTEK_01370 [Tepidamorphus sp. 3E244]|uniref:hypothetical protein n=1 Tax=Tepidamorphus sp. 3E244 TaxID=3385498 RepID=UPI0038FD3F14